jgi:hypothetical protein
VFIGEYNFTVLRILITAYHCQTSGVPSTDMVLYALLNFRNGATIKVMGKPGKELI